MANQQPPAGGNIQMQPPGQKATGYPALASVMGPFNRLGMYKMFASLNSHSLLLRQAEPIHLEMELRACISVDKAAGSTLHESAYDMINSYDPKGADAGQWRLVLKLRKKLDEYNAALLQQAEMAKLSRPRRYNLGLLRDWLARAEGGNNFLGPDEDRPWLDGEESDLVAVSTDGHDSLTHWIEERVVPLSSNYGLLRKPPALSHHAVGLVEWHDSLFWTIAKGLSVTMSTAIPSVAIVVLYLIDNMNQRILAACLLTFLFSAALAVATSARPAEVFAATAA